MPLPIDHDLDVGFANAIARLESYNRHHYRPNSYLHKWWARRCGSTVRLVLKALVSDPGSQPFTAPGGLENTLILDPMMGGGTVLHEAIRLGANVIGADLDPIPVLQARASLSRLPLQELEDAFEHLFSTLRHNLAHLYQTCCPVCHRASEIQFTLYGVRRHCRCGSVLLVDSLLLRQERDGSNTTLCPRCGNVLPKGRTCTCSEAVSRHALYTRDTKACPRCNERLKEDHARPLWTRYQPIAIAGHCEEHKLFLASPSESDLHLLDLSDRERPSMPAEDFEVKDGAKSGDLRRRGVTSYLELFSSRQLLYLDTAIKCLDAYGSMVRLNLALLISTSLDFNCMLSGYKGSARRRPGAVRHVFSHHAYSFPYTSLENNPLFPARTSGTLQQLFHNRIRRGRQWAKRPVERTVDDQGLSQVIIAGEEDAGQEITKFDQLLSGTHRFMLIQGSSVSLDLPSGIADFVVTDPPYFDSVQYSDLAAFFHVWLRAMLPDQAQWAVDEAQAAVAPHAGAKTQYASILGRIFTECERVLNKTDGRLIFTFHHWRPEAWSGLTLALRRAGFRLRAHYTVHSENPMSVHISGLRALRHDAILVLMPACLAVERTWSIPDRVTLDDSALFCQDCASVLGWMLAATLEDDEIEQHWVSLLAPHRATNGA